MPAINEEIKRRQSIALAAIKSAYGTEDDQYGVTLFVSHHLEELQGIYWEEHLKDSWPDPLRILGLLELQSPSAIEDPPDMDTFDFTLPGNVTDHLLCVRFDKDGEIEEISMES